MCAKSDMKLEKGNERVERTSAYRMWTLLDDSGETNPHLLHSLLEDIRLENYRDCGVVAIEEE